MKFPVEHPKLVGVAPDRVPWGWAYRGPLPLPGSDFVWMGQFDRGLVQAIASLQVNEIHPGAYAIYMVSAKLKESLKNVDGEAMRRIAHQFFADGATFELMGHYAMRVL